jgi:predicted nucleotidyltransferase
LEPKRMVNRKSIEDFSGEVVRNFHPERIILFGSYTYGMPTEDSDVDLLIIMPFKGKPIQKASEILRKLKPRIPVELLVRTPVQVKQRLAMNDHFLREIVEKGKVLYESPHA